MAKYRMFELFDVYNKNTGKVSYYVRACFQKAKRISVAKYGALYMQAFRIDCVYTQTSVNYIRNYRTVYIHVEA